MLVRVVGQVVEHHGLKVLVSVVIGAQAEICLVLVLEPDARVLVKGDERIQLRPKEAELLSFFMANAGRVVSREELMKEVWETDYFEDTRTLSVHVRWLRIKIEDDPNEPRMLRTVRGVGYYFQSPEPDETAE